MVSLVWISVMVCIGSTLVEPKIHYPLCKGDVIHPGICGIFCKSDRHCDPSHTCCRSGCYVGCFPKQDKPGSCPDRNNGAGACYVDCGTDADCPGSEKCCGSCPRICEKPC